MTRQMRWVSLVTLGATVAVGAVGCLGQGEDDSATTTQIGALLGDAIPGTNGTTFAAARANFIATESAVDGLGPIFNEHACGNCHQNGSVGGAGQQIEQRYGTITNGTFNSLASTGGSLRQLFGIGGFNVGGLNCNSGVDSNPAPGATLFAGRLTTPTFGLGLVDSLPDSVFATLASREPAAIRGTPRLVTIVLPNPLDSSQTLGGTRVGRFGWKANVPSLAQFSADAYLNEMGITTTSCTRGARNGAFATENRANRAGTNAIINGCPDDQKPGVDDDFAAENNNCAGGLNELQDDVANFTFFMAHLAPPPQVAITAGTAQDRGRTLFNSSTLMCSGCHRSDCRHLRVDLGRRHPGGDQVPAVLRLPGARHGDGRRSRSASTTATRSPPPASCGRPRCGGCARETSSSTTGGPPTSPRRFGTTTAGRSARGRRPRRRSARSARRSKAIW